MAGRNFSISVGVDRYRDGGLGQLSFAHSDAKTIHELVRDLLRYGERSLLLPPSIDAVQFMNEVREFLVHHDVRVNDRVFVYFAGHGVQVQAKPRGDQYLLLSKARLGPLMEGHIAGNDVLSVRGLLEEFDCYFADFVLLLDACRNPPGKRHEDDEQNVYDSVQSVLQGLTSRDVRVVRKKPSAQWSEPARKSKRHLVVNSCGDKGRSHEITTLRRGLFAGALAGWLRETVSAGGPAVLDRKAIDELGQKMNESASQAGIKVHQQPWISSDSKGFVLYVRDESSAPIAGEEAVQWNAHDPTVAQSRPRPPVLPATTTRTATANFCDVDAPWCPEVRILGTPLAGPTLFRLAVSIDPITITQYQALTPDESRQLKAAMASRARRDALPLANTVPVTWLTRTICERWLETFNAAIQRAYGLSWPPYRLLTFDEWTYACTCGLKAHYVLGKGAVRNLGHDDAVFRYSEIDDGRRYSPSANPRAPVPVNDPRNKVNYFGLRGMYGNVRELATTTTGQTILMGGGYRSGPARLRARSFENATPDVPQADVGFRIARSLRPEESA